MKLIPESSFFSLFEYIAWKEGGRVCLTGCLCCCSAQACDFLLGNSYKAAGFLPETQVENCFTFNLMEWNITVFHDIWRTQNQIWGFFALFYMHVNICTYTYQCVYTYRFQKMWKEAKFVCEWHKRYLYNWMILYFLRKLKTHSCSSHHCPSAS